MLKYLKTSVAAALAAAMWAHPVAAQGLKVAVFDFELIDTSQEGESGERADETRRLVLIGERLRQMMTERGVIVVDVAPVRARVAAEPIRSCNGCESAIARDLGAEIAATGTVQKVSNLILNINVALRDVASGTVMRAGSVDIRGNTDDSWLRGVSYLTRNRLFDPPLVRHDQKR